MSVKRMMMVGGLLLATVASNNAVAATEGRVAGPAQRADQQVIEESKTGEVAVESIETLTAGGQAPAATSFNGCESAWQGCMAFAIIFAPFLIPACYADFQSCAGYPHR